MARPLSNIEWATFMTEVQPDNLGLPAWGGIVNWGGEYVLCFKMPSGEWALSDVTDGIPSQGQIIPITTYLQNIPSSQPSWAHVFVYSLPANMAQVALQDTAAIGSLATQALQITEQMIGDALKGIIQPAAEALTPALWPIAIAAMVVLFVMYGRK
jgi:hypothetical protein